MAEECSHECSSCGVSGCGDRTAEAGPSTLAPNKRTNVKHVIGVVSGKGGVGKSLVTSLLASEMNKRGHKVAILDADITGPSIPKSFGVDSRLTADADGINPAKSASGIEVMSVNLMLPEGVRIDHRSLEAQGIERIPTIHEDHASREITKRGGHSILNAINRRIATANRYLTAIRKQMGDPTGLLGQFKEQARKELDTAMSRFRESLVFDRQPIASRGRQLVEARPRPPGARPAGAWNPSLIPCRGRSDANRGVPSRNRWTNWTRPGVSSPTSPNGGRPSLHGKSGTCNGSSTWRARPAKRPSTRTRSRADGSDTRPRGPPPSNPSF